MAEIWSNSLVPLTHSLSAGQQAETILGQLIYQKTHKLNYSAQDLAWNHKPKNAADGRASEVSIFHE